MSAVQTDYRHLTKSIAPAPGIELGGSTLKWYDIAPADEPVPGPIRALARGGRLVTCGATSGPEAVTDIRYIYGRRLSILGSWMGTKDNLRAAMRLVDLGRLRPVVHEVFPLNEAARAQGVMERSEHFGKLVLRVPE